MHFHRLVRIMALCLLFGAGLRPASVDAAEAPTAAQALALTPIQKLVEYSTPTKEEAAECTNSAEKTGNTTAWVVRNKQNEVLRRFADTNGDNVVDQWCYYLDGLEVYRDIDANFNGKADQYRWFHTSGTRWGVDKNEDGRIDSWRTISPHEVGEQVVFAIKMRDPARFALLLATPAELNNAGFAKERAEQIAATISAAPAEFSKLLEEQKTLTPDSRFVDFGSARPAAIPAGTNGSTKDVVVADNASALVETDDKHEQVSLGTLVAIGDTWKLIAAPTIGANAQQQAGLVAQAAEPQNPTAGGGAPSEEMQQLMSDLEKLDRESADLPEDKQAANVEARAEKLKRLAEIAPESDRDQWHRQLADMLSVAAQSGNYPQGLEQLDKLQKTLADAGASEDAISHAVFQRMWADYVTTQRDPKANAAQVQDKWLKDLEAFVAKYPKSTDTAEGLLQLGMYQEFVGKTDEATKWYQQLVTDFPKAEPANKANGALRRLGSVGKPIRLSGADLGGAKVDLASANYRRKVVLIHYWATWCEPCKQDMVLLKSFYAKKGGRDFEIIGVCLDHDAAGAKQFVAQERFAWKQLHEPGGLDGRLANEMGVMTLPVMILVDQNGNVANNNIQAAQLEAEYGRLTGPAGNAANLPRSAPLPK